jgi:two-component system cell cycle response regulator
MRILIAEDDAISRRILEATLKRSGYDVVAACDGHAAWDALQAPDAPRMAILDWMMPGMDGPEVCRAVRKRGDQGYVYLLLLTAREGKQALVEGLEAGADDYLVKPFDAFELKARLDVGRRILDLQRQLLSAYEEMRQRATHDALTGVYNRGAILEHLQQEWNRTQREGGTLGVIMCDLDHFKRVNDTYGHPAGDAVLREAARRMRSTVRSYDAVGRYGGEEFLIVLPRCTPNTICSLAERLRERIAGEPVSIGSTTLPISMSIGVSIGYEQRDVEPHALLHAADAALYKAKHTGRNRVVCSAETHPELSVVTA